MAAMGVEGKAGVIPEYGAVPQREPVDYCPLGYERERKGFRSHRTAGVQGMFDFTEQGCGRSEERAGTLNGRTASGRYHGLIVETMAEGALIFSQDGVLLYCNEAFSRMMCLPVESLIGSSFSVLVHPDYRERFSDMLGTCRESGAVQGEILFRSGDGSNPAFCLLGNVWKTDDEDEVCIVVTDIAVRGTGSEPKQARMRSGSRRGQTKDAGAVAALTGSFIHDFNNVLSAIIGFSEMSLEDISEDHPAKNHAAQILKAAMRGRDLVRQILPPDHGNKKAPDVRSPGTDRMGAKEGKPSPAPAGGKERILLVDDEDAIIEMGQSMLRRLGYRVNAVSDGVQALKMFRGEPNAFDLIITDHAMPRMTGAELARELWREARRARHPVHGLQRGGQPRNSEGHGHPGDHHETDLAERSRRYYQTGARRQEDMRVGRSGLHPQESLPASCRFTTRFQGAGKF